MPVNPIPFDFTEVSAKWFRTKSPAFQRIETALNYYLNQPPSWRNLKVLQRMIAAWRATKEGPTIRDNAMLRLDNWLRGEVAGLKPWPDREPGWDARHNCYAYSMHCQNGANGNNARPGKLAGPGHVRHRQSDDFADGVLDDALSQGKQAWVLRKGGNPNPVPALTHGGYLVVMISMPMGYHFMRRSNATGLWTHKNGAIRDEETSWLDPDDHLLEDAIDDAAMIKVITDPRIVDGPWVFDAYLEIPLGGIVVAG